MPHGITGLERVKLSWWFADTYVQMSKHNLHKMHKKEHVME
jgi:hypothetical protein